MLTKIRRLIALIAGLAVIIIPSASYASNAPTLNQTINTGTLTTNIYQSDDKTPVASPAVAFPAQNYGFTCVTSTATLGDANDLINVTNLANGINTWTLSMAATNGTSTNWTNGTQTYSYNTPAGSGCTSGQLTVNPSVATLTDDCNSQCTNTNVTLGSSTAFNGTTTSSVTLLSDSTGTAWEGYIEGVGLSQTIPPLQHSGAYSIGMTITIANT